MPDRNVRIVITAAAADALKAFKDVENGLKGIDEGGEKASGIGEKIKTGLAVVGVALSLEGVKNALIGVVNTGLEFEANLNTMQAVSGASADAMGLVSERAKQLGNDILLPGQSASDAAEAMTELAKGGMSVDEAMTAAKGTLQLAAAAQISGADAATIQTSALNAFGLSAANAGRVADVLANVANQSAGEITDFAQGLAQSATVAHSFGIGVEDTATALGIFANAGIKGSDAGTSFKTMLTALASPTKQQATALQELGVTAFDAQGKFVGMKTIVEQLSTAKANMTQQDYLSAASTAFGADAVRAASVIADGGAVAWDNMSAAVGKVGGAADVAAAQSQGLNGMISDFQNTVETAALSLFEKMAPALESVVGFATSAASAFATVLGWVTQIPGPVFEAAAAFGAIVVGAQVATWLGGIAATALAAAGGLASMGGAAMLASVALNALGGPWVVALGVAAAAIAFFADNTDAATVATADLTGAIDANTGAFTSNAAAIISQQTEDAAAKYVALGGAVGDFTAALMGAPAAQERVNATLLDASVAAAQAAGASDEYIAALKEGGVGAQQFIDTTKEGEASVAGFAGATGTAAEVSQVYSAGLQQLTETQAGAKTAAEEAAAANTTQAAAMTDSADAAAAAAPSVDSLKAATEGLQSAANLADAAVQFLSASLDAASGHAISQEQAYRLQEAAIRGISASTRDTADAMATADEKAQAVTDAINKYGAGSTQAAQAQRDYEGAVQATTDATDDQFTANLKARDSALAFTTSVYANAAANGDLTGASDQATYALQQAKDAFIAAQPQADILSGKAQQTADKLYGIPKDTVAKIAETGAAATQGAAQGVSTAVGQIPGSKSTTITAVDNASSVIAYVQRLRDNLADKTITITTNTRALGSTGPMGNLAIESGGHLFAADGLTTGRGVSQKRKGMGGGVTWAEAATGEEYYLSMKPSMQTRNRALASEAVASLGGEAVFPTTATYVPPAASMSAALSSGYSGGGAAVNVAAPVVKVFIGDEEITSRVSVVVDGQLAAVARQANTMGGQSWA